MATSDRSNTSAWLITGALIALLGGVVGYFMAPDAPLLEQLPWLTALLGALICGGFIALLCFAERYQL